MENQIKVNIWIDELLNEINNNSLTNFNPSDSSLIRMTNHQYDEIFSYLVKGKTIRVGNLELIDKTLSQALNDMEKEDAQNKIVHIYTADDYKIQNAKFEKLINNKDLFLTFGLLDYFDDNRMVVKSAPLVLMPIKLEYLPSQKAYQISCINHEVMLNNALIEKLISTRRIDISYPLENDFSLIEFLTYVSTKVRNYHFSVNNGCFITNLNVTTQFIYRDFISRKKEISNLPLIKSISYLNAEFYNLNKATSVPLNNHYLSLLDLDNEEYKIVKKLNLRNNAFIRTNSIENKYHLLTNIVYDFLLNNKTILLSYDDNDSYKEIMNFVKTNGLEEFALNLSINKTSKEHLIDKLLRKDKLDFDVKLIDQGKIDETVDTYYLLKNNFKKFINALRKNNEPMQYTINRTMEEYYALDEYPLINIEIPNVDLIDENKLKEYLSAINSFTSSLEKLRCNYIDHPFYGFNNLNCDQNQYKELKEKITLLSNEFNHVDKSFSLLETKYNLPFPKTLKDMKSILNIVSLIPECVNLPLELFEINNYEDVLSTLTKHNDLFNSINELRTKIISLYEDKVFLIDNKELKERLSSKNIKRKIINSYRQYFMKKVKVDESILNRVCNDLEEYYSLEQEIKSIYDNNSLFHSYYSEGTFDINLIKQKFSLIKQFNENVDYLNKHDINYSYKKLSFFNEENIKDLLSDRKKGQIAFNHLLTFTNYLQKYFDSSLIDFASIPLISLENKISKASKNFLSINDYLNFYLSQKKLNHIIPNLADELLKYPRSDTYIAMFMKRFYYQYASSFMDNNPTFKNYSNETFFQSLENYQGYNDNRLEIINALIKNNLKFNLQNNILALRSIEIPYLNSLKNSEIKVLPLHKLFTQTKTSILSLFPLIIMPLKDTSIIFEDQSTRFDVNIVISNDEIKTKYALPNASRADQLIVFDSHLISEESDSNIYNQSSEFFSSSCSQSLVNINYISSSYKSNILKSNNIDISLKKHLMNKLKNHDLLVSKDVNTAYGTIDILVKTPQSSRPTAVIVDRLNYYSLESAIDSFNKTQDALNKLGFACYRVISSIYFKNEETEFKKLLSFIITNTIQEKNIQKVSKVRPLVDVIFNEYVDLYDAYYQIQDKQNKSQNDVMIELLKKCAPISKDQIIETIGDSAVVSLANLQMEKIISISNGFVFLNNHPIEFKRVDRNSEKVRLLSTVSNEEIAEGIVKILTQKSLYEDEMIKLILLSLGLKKMNHSQYFRIQNIIKGLVEDQRIYSNNELLSFTEQE